MKMIILAGFFDKMEKLAKKGCKNFYYVIHFPTDVHKHAVPFYQNKE
jgi:hypothetical protein